MPTIIDALHGNYTDIINYLEKSAQPSLSSDVNKYFKKLMALSIGSYFEHEIQNILIEFVSIASKNDIRIINLLRQKAILMQYHTYFDWGEKDRPEKPGKNANKFFAMFGDQFKNDVQEDIKKNEGLGDSIKAFVELGHLRNILVHSNFAAYNFENKTTAELYELYNKAVQFLEYLRHKLLIDH